MHAVLDQPFDADEDVCRTDIMLQKFPNSPDHHYDMAITHGVHTTRTQNFKYYRPTATRCRAGDNELKVTG